MHQELRSDAEFASNDVLFAPKLEVSLSTAMVQPLRTPSLPRRIDFCCPSEDEISMVECTYLTVLGASY